MAKKVENKDLFSDDVFKKTVADVELLILELNKLEATIVEVAKAQKTILGKSDTKSIEGIRATNDSINKLNETEKMHLKLQKDKITLETKLKAARTVLAQDNAVLSTQVQQQNKIIKEAAKETLGLTNHYQKLSKEVKLAKGHALAMGTQFRMNSKQFIDASRKAGELADKMNDVNAATKVFSSGSKFEQFGTSLKGVGSSLASLDFAEASEKAKVLVAISKSMTFKEAIEGMKGIGSTILSVGKAMLANPFILIVSALVGLGLAAKSLFDTFQAGNKIMEETRKEMREVGKETEQLAKKQRDLAVDNDLKLGKISEKEAKRLKNMNALKDEIMNNQDARYTAILKAEKLFEEQRNTIAMKALMATSMGGYNVLVQKFEKQKLQTILDINKEYDKKRLELINVNVEERRTVLADEFEKEKDTNNKNNEELLEQEKDAFRKRQEELERYRLELEDVNNRLIKDDTDRQLKTIETEFTRKIKAITGNSKTEKELRRKLLIEMDREMDVVRKNQFDKIKDSEKEKGLELMAEEDQSTKEILDKQAKKDKEAIDKKTKAQEELTKASFEVLGSMLEAQQQKELKAMDKQISATEKRVDQLRKKAELGQLASAESLAFEEKKQAELEQQRLQAQKLQQREQALFTVISTYQQKIANNDPNPLLSTIKDVAVLKSFAATLAGFIDGTDDVGKSLGKPQLSGKDGHIIRVDGKEQIWSEKDRAAVGFRSRDEIKDLVGLVDNNMLKNITNRDMFNPASFVLNGIMDKKVLDKLDGIEKAVSKIDIPEGMVKIDEVRGLINLYSKKSNKQTITRSKLFN